MLPTTFPNRVCLFVNSSARSRVMKNCELFVLRRDELAIPSRPRLLYQSVCIAQQSCYIVADSLVETQATVRFILEWFTIDALATFTSPRRVTRLNDEAFDNAMKNNIVVVAFWSGCQRPVCCVGVLDRTLHSPSMLSCTKLRTAKGASLPHSSISISPWVVTMITFPLVAG